MRTIWKEGKGWVTQSTVAYIREQQEKRDRAAEKKDRRVANVVRRQFQAEGAIIPDPDDEHRARHLVGDAGHWIQYVETANDGREKWAVYLPNGQLVMNEWTKEAAAARVDQLNRTGSVTR